MENILEFKNVSKSYDDKKVLDNISFAIVPNEFVTLLGPSGCGKTTILRIIGGFDVQDTGTLTFMEKGMNELSSTKRQVNTVFQNYALFPHLNVYDNIAFSLKNQNVKREVIDLEVKKMLKLVKLFGYENRSISQLSGGEKQRVAIARALINKPKILLLDEPLAALDLKLRQEMQYELKHIQMQLGITFIYVTHDQEEALTMSDRIIILNDSRIQQIGTPEDIYNEPENEFAASFIGESNIISAVMLEDNLVEIFNKQFTCVDGGFKKNELVHAVIRPEDIVLRRSNKEKLCGVIEDVVFKGVHYEHLVLVEGMEFVVHTLKCLNVGDEVSLNFEPEDIHIMKIAGEIL